MTARRPAMRALGALLAALSFPGTALAQKGYACPSEITSAAQIGPSGPMQFTLQKIGQARILVAEGGIETDTPAALEKALKANAPITEIWLRSGGGNAIAGNRAAEIVRHSGIPVRIPRDWWCISACNFLFFGGTIRMIDPGGEFGVHMATVVNNAEFQKYVTEMARKGAATNLLAWFAVREQSMAQLTADDIDVILKMGISRKLLSEVIYAQRADQFRDEDGDGKYDFGKVATYRCLTRDEMIRYNVVNVD